MADAALAATVAARTADASLRATHVAGRTGESVAAAPASVDHVLTSTGQPLEPGLRREMEHRFGHDFSHVRVHTDIAAQQSARDVDARAYTVGRHLVFDSGRFAPRTHEGQQLIAHELAHVVQQAQGPKLLQRAPGDPPGTSIGVGPFEIDLSETDLEHLQVAKGALDLTLHAISGEPLTSEEMYELLLIRRAEPLSIPATVVNEAPERIKELDTKIAALDKQIQDARAEIGKLQTKQKGATGFPRDMIARQIKKLKRESAQLEPERKKLLADKVKLQRGKALGTPGEGAPAGTGRITYAGIQVIDASGKRIAVEFAETSATEHAEERIIARLRANLTPEQLKGARIVVVGDQKVCEKRCQRALIAFAEEFGIESIEGKRFVRPRIGGPGEASARTTARTATQPKSVGLPLREVTDPIYRRPPSPSAPPAAEQTTTQTATPVAPTRARTAPPEAGTESTRAPSNPEEGVHPPLRVRARGTVMEIGGNVLVELILDLVAMKYQQWRNDRKLRDRLAALEPALIIQKNVALYTYLKDPWAPGTSGQYYNILLRITSTTTTAIGGGRAIVIPGSPRPEIVQVAISSRDENRLVSEDEAVRLFHVKEGATGAVYQNVQTQLVVYSEPVQ